MRDRVKNYISLSFPILLVLFAWMNTNRFALPYRVLILQLALGCLIGVVYFGIRARQGARIPYTPLWWLLVLLFLYFVVSILTSGNPHAGIPRFLSLLSLAILFLGMWDAYRHVLDHKIVLYSLFILLFVFMVLGILELFREYSDWWSIFGLSGMTPPYMYRIVGVLNSSNYLMAALNLLAPVCFVLFIQIGHWWKKALLILWLAMYVIVAIFASSRGGYVGAAVGFGSLILLNLKRIDPIGQYRKLSPFLKIFVGIGSIIAIIVVGYMTYSFVLSTSAHPSHGSDGTKLNLNRTAIWQGYLRPVKLDPLMGSGIGRLVLGYFEANRGTPPGWFPPHAHSLPIGFLSEFGILGLSIIIVLLGWAALRVGKTLIALKPEQGFVASGVAAGLISFAAHSLFDDFLTFITVFVIALILVAWLITFEKHGGQVNTSPKISWLIPAVLSIMLLGFFNLRPYKLISEALEGMKAGLLGYKDASILVEDAVGMAPNSQAYLSIAAFFWTDYFANEGFEPALDRAEYYYQRSLELEPGMSTMWVNKSMISWLSGKGDQAIREIERSLKLAPDEPVYHLNAGFYYEKIGDNRSAIEHYDIALHESKMLGWSNHPFWEQTLLRQTVISDFLSENDLPEDSLNLSAFFEARRSNQIKEMEQILAIQSWSSSLDEAPGLLMMRGMLEFEKGDYQSAKTSIQRSFSYTHNPIRLSSLGWWLRSTYAIHGWETNLIPGVLQLSQDYGQFSVFEEISFEMQAHLKSEYYCELEKEKFLAVSGGQLWDDEVFIPLMCQK